MWVNPSKLRRFRLAFRSINFREINQMNELMDGCEGTKVQDGTSTGKYACALYTCYGYILAYVYNSFSTLSSVAHHFEFGLHYSISHLSLASPQGFANYRRHVALRRLIRTSYHYNSPDIQGSKCTCETLLLIRTRKYLRPAVLSETNTPSRGRRLTDAVITVQCRQFIYFYLVPPALFFSIFSN
jgi:hypothetical protein